MNKFQDLDLVMFTLAPLISVIWFITLLFMILGNFSGLLGASASSFLLIFGVAFLLLNFVAIAIIASKDYRKIAFFPLAYAYWFILSIVSFYSLFLEISGSKRKWYKVRKTGAVSE